MAVKRPKAAKDYKEPKAEAIRRREAEMIRAQLDDLGLPPADVAAAHDALRLFAEQGVGETRTWKVPAFNVTVSLLLSTQPHIVSYARVSKMR